MKYVFIALIQFYRIVLSPLKVFLGMDGLGPSGGRAREFGLLFGSRSVSSLDHVAARIMGFGAGDLPYLREAQWALWSRAGARVLDELGETTATRRVELTALMGAVFGVVTSSFLATPGDAHAPEPSAGPQHLEHVLTLLEHGFAP